MRGRRGTFAGPTSSSPRYRSVERSPIVSRYGDEASNGPAPPRRAGIPSPPSSSTRTPSDCSSTSSVRSSTLRRAGLKRSSATTGVQILVVAPEDAVLELLGDPADAVDLPVLAVEVRPRLVGPEQHAVAADARALDLGQQPAGPEPHRPRGVGVDLVALLGPLQEARHQPDVAGHPAAEVHEVDLAPLPVLLHERDEVR